MHRPDSQIGTPSSPEMASPWIQATHVAPAGTAPAVQLTSPETPRRNNVALTVGVLAAVVIAAAFALWKVRSGHESEAPPTSQPVVSAAAALAPQPVAQPAPPAPAFPNVVPPEIASVDTPIHPAPAPSNMPASRPLSPVASPKGKHPPAGVATPSTPAAASPSPPAPAPAAASHPTVISPFSSMPRAIESSSRSVYDHTYP